MPGAESNVGLELTMLRSRLDLKPRVGHLLSHPGAPGTVLIIRICSSTFYRGRVGPVSTFLSTETHSKMSRKCWLVYKDYVYHDMLKFL